MSCAFNARFSRSTTSTDMPGSLALQEPPHLASLDRVGHAQPVALRLALEHARGGRAAARDRAEEPEQVGPGHVRADRLWRLPRDEREAQERDGVQQPP